MFSTDFIFRQQENLVDNQKCQAGFRPLCNKILFLTFCNQGVLKSRDLVQPLAHELLNGLELLWSSGLEIQCLDIFL